MGEEACGCAARVVLELIDQAETLLPKYPAIGRPGRVLGTRELVIGHLPYIIAYRMRGTDLEILRVLHSSRIWPDEM